MASYAVKKRTDGKKKHYYWNDYRFEGGKIVKYRFSKESRKGIQKDLRFYCI